MSRMTCSLLRPLFLGGRCGFTIGLKRFKPRASPDVTGGLPPPKQSSKPHQIETWNTVNQWSFCQLLNVTPPAQTQSPPTENFLATVLPRAPNLGAPQTFGSKENFQHFAKELHLYFCFGSTNVFLLCRYQKISIDKNEREGLKWMTISRLFSFHDVEIWFCYVYAWNKTPESIFQNSNYTMPVKWGTFVQPRCLSCCFVWVRYGVKTWLACTVAEAADTQWSKMLTVCNTARVKLGCSLASILCSNLRPFEAELLGCWVLLQCGNDPWTSGRMDCDVIDVNSAPDKSAKESSYFHVHGSH